jgi:pyrimidine oxygenase
VGILSAHPAVAARMAVTIDSIAPNRFGLNIVTGWNPLEYSQMGLWPGDDYFGYRYNYAREYVSILRELWSTGRSGFIGEHFSLEDCDGKRLPAGHRVEIVCAGGSPSGREFAAQHGDVNFVSSSGMAEAVVDLRSRAAAHRRVVAANVLQMVIIADSDEAAWDRIRAFNATTDEQALSGRRSASSRDSSGGGTAERGRAMVTAIDESTVIAGSAGTVAARLREIERTGFVDGISLQFDDFHEGLDRFGSDVLPRLS